MLAGIMPCCGCAIPWFDGKDVVQVELVSNRPLALSLVAAGICAYESNDLCAARDHFEQATKADPSYGPAWNNLGLCDYEAGILYRAALAFHEAANVMPDNAEPHNHLAMCFEAGGKFDEAIAYYETAHQLNIANPLYLGNLVRARMRRGDVDPSIRVQLQELLFIENRPEWVEWVHDQLALFTNPYLSRESGFDEFTDELNRDDEDESGPAVDPVLLGPYPLTTEETPRPSTSFRPDGQRFEAPVMPSIRSDKPRSAIPMPPHLANP